MPSSSTESGHRPIGLPFMLFLASTFGCMSEGGNASGSSDESGSTSSDDDDDDASEASDSQDATSSGGAQGPGPCEQVLACAEASEETPLTPLLAQYGPDGTCWAEFDREACWNDCTAVLSGLSSFCELGVAECCTGAECPGGGGPAGPGTPCAGNDDCLSGVCVLYRDAPPTPDAVCGEATACATRVTGTVLDMSSRQPVADVQVRILGATDVLTDPDADPIVAATSNAEGIVDATSGGPVSAPIALFALAGGGEHALTATNIAIEIEGGRYAPGTSAHDLWTVPAGLVQQWSTALEEDAEAAPVLGDGLGFSGGALGLVRAGDGMPIAGAVVTPMSGASGAVVRYPRVDGSVAADATDDSGLVVIVGSGPTGETFAASANGLSDQGTVGNVPNLLLAVAFELE